jgi:hypothetical protein
MSCESWGGRGLSSQERFDNWFSDSAAWTAHREAAKARRA